MGITIRRIQPEDREQWNPLWKGYADFYHVEMADDVTQNTWSRFFKEDEPVHAFVAENEEGTLVGMVHFLTHDSTWSVEKTCYLEDLFVSPDGRRHGTGEKLINAVVDEARRNGNAGVYWHTQHENYKGRSLYDKVAGMSEFTQYMIELH